MFQRARSRKLKAIQYCGDDGGYVLSSRNIDLVLDITAESNRGGRNTQHNPQKQT